MSKSPQTIALVVENYDKTMEEVLQRFLSENVQRVLLDPTEIPAAVFEDSEEFRKVVMHGYSNDDPRVLVIRSKEELYQVLSKSNIRQVFTTNFDRLLERALLSKEEARLNEPPAPPPPMEPLCHFLQTFVPVLYAQVLEPTLADLRLEYSAALAKGWPFKARRVLLQGCGALAAAAICQFGYSLVGRIAALWRARSPK